MVSFSSNRTQCTTARQRQATTISRLLCKPGLTEPASQHGFLRQAAPRQSQPRSPQNPLHISRESPAFCQPCHPSSPIGSHALQSGHLTHISSSRAPLICHRHHVPTPATHTLSQPIDHQQNQPHKIPKTSPKLRRNFPRHPLPQVTFPTNANTHLPGGFQTCSGGHLSDNASGLGS